MTSLTVRVLRKTLLRVCSHSMSNLYVMLELSEFIQLVVRVIRERRYRGQLE